jgi:hypothetical protein
MEAGRDNGQGDRDRNVSYFLQFMVEDGQYITRDGSSA